MRGRGSRPGNGPELTLDEVLAKYPGLPRTVALKIDVQRRGVAYSPAALAAVDPAVHMTTVASDYYDKTDPSPVSLTLPDGTSVFTEGVLADIGLDPYLVDHDGRTAFLSDEGARLADITYWERPSWYGKKTASGREMWRIVSARPQRLTIHPHQHCDFWRLKGQGCKFCVMAHNFKASAKEARLIAEDVVETVAEAVKEPGGGQSVFLTGGSVLSGEEPLDDELEMYLEILKGIGPVLGGGRFPSQLISTAFSARQLHRLRDETGLMSWTADIEVLGDRAFDWLCPGKSRLIGYQGWLDRLAAAVPIFGRGHVNTGLVVGTELAVPGGPASEDEAIARNLAEADRLMARGVWVVGCVWRVLKGSVLQRQRPASLEYHARMALGLNELRRAHGFEADMDNYRRCGNHPDTDLARLDRAVKPSERALEIRSGEPSERSLEILAGETPESPVEIRASGWREVIDDPLAVKILGTADPDGRPRLSVKSSIRLGEGGSIELWEIVETSRSGANLLSALWFGGRATILILAPDGRSFSLDCRPVKTEIAGEGFRRRYLENQARYPDSGLSAVWILSVEASEETTLAVRRGVEEAGHPLLIHLDRLAGTVKPTPSLA